MTSPTKEAIERVRRLLLIYEPGDLLDQYEVDAIEDLLASHDKLVEGLKRARNGLVAARPVLQYVPGSYGREGREKAVQHGVDTIDALLEELGQ